MCPAEHVGFKFLFFRIAWEPCCPDCGVEMIWGGNQNVMKQAGER